MTTVDSLEKSYREQIQSLDIKSIQIDPNGFCGSKCIFCCVRYIDRPLSTQLMSVEMFRNIIQKLRSLFPSVFPFLWLSSYNDILLDPHLCSRLSVLREFGLSFTVLSNGIGLLKNLSNLIPYHGNVINGYLLNIPAGNAQDYSFFTQGNEEIYNQVIRGVTELYQSNPSWAVSHVNITVNGSYSDEYAKLQLKYTVSDNNTELQLAQLRGLFPYFNITDARPLCDRAGSLKPFAIDNSVMPIRNWWKLPISAEIASGCNGGSRLTDWIHITNSGHLITCCQDYEELHSYGHMNDADLRTILTSNARVSAIMNSLRHMCTRCWFSY